VLPKNSWPRVLGSVGIQLYAGECTPSVDRAEQSTRSTRSRAATDVMATVITTYCSSIAKLAKSIVGKISEKCCRTYEYKTNL